MSIKNMITLKEENFMNLPLLYISLPTLIKGNDL